MSALSTPGAKPAASVRLGPSLIEALVTMATTTPGTSLTAGDVITAILDSKLLSIHDLEATRRRCQQEAKKAALEATILTEATVQVGDRVMINDAYYWKSLQGMTGMVMEKIVNRYKRRSGTTMYVQLAVRPDHALPKRAPRYALDPDGNIRVLGHQVDPLPLGGPS